MKINRIITNLCSKNVKTSKAFYINLFNFNVAFDSDWFVNLVSEGNELELGIMQSDHDLIPDEYKGKPNGMYITLVVDSAVAIYEKAKELGVEIVHPPEMTFYGQKRLLLKDPGGVLVDVSSPEGDFSSSLWSSFLLLKTTLSIINQCNKLDLKHNNTPWGGPQVKNQWSSANFNKGAPFFFNTLRYLDSS